METDNNKEYARLSALCRRHLKAGMLDWYAYDLKAMGALFGREGRYIDKLKALMVAFYIDLSGISCPPFADRAILVSMRIAVEKAKMTSHQIDELYMDTIRFDTTPCHKMSVKDSLYILQLCLNERFDEVNKILSNL